MHHRPDAAAVAAANVLGVAGAGTPPANAARQKLPPPARPARHVPSASGPLPQQPTRQGPAAYRVRSVARQTAAPLPVRAQIEERLRPAPRRRRTTSRAPTRPTSSSSCRARASSRCGVYRERGNVDTLCCDRPLQALYRALYGQVLDRLLAKLYAGGHRVVLFSQFTSMLDVLDDVLRMRGYEFSRLDGGTNRVQIVLHTSPRRLDDGCTPPGGVGARGFFAGVGSRPGCSSRSTRDASPPTPTWKRATPSSVNCHGRESLGCGCCADSDRDRCCEQTSGNRACRRCCWPRVLAAFSRHSDQTHYRPRQHVANLGRGTVRLALQGHGRPLSRERQLPPQYRTTDLHWTRWGTKSGDLRVSRERPPRHQLKLALVRI